MHQPDALQVHAFHVVASASHLYPWAAGTVCIAQASTQWYQDRTYLVRAT